MRNKMSCVYYLIYLCQHNLHKEYDSLVVMTQWTKQTSLIKVADICDGKVQEGCNLFHNLQTWQSWESGQQLDRFISLLSCIWLAMTEPCKPIPHPMLQVSFAEDIGHHSLETTPVHERINVSGFLRGYIHRQTHHPDLSLIILLCAITPDFRSKYIWQRLTKPRIPCDVSRCTRLLN